MRKVAGFMLDADDVLKITKDQGIEDDANAVLRTPEEVEFKGKKAICMPLRWPPGIQETKLCVIVRSSDNAKEFMYRYKEMLPEKEDQFWLKWMEDRGLDTCKVWASWTTVPNPARWESPMRPHNKPMHESIKEQPKQLPGLTEEQTTVARKPSD
ncbi:hypothetical protein DFH11DRAFT_1563393 [Phellopilus nigrolimitatus]|nr:hypothetical protein DFH11DRAFT_1563393 [Phellopilus nigrolimitatus]